MTTDLARCYATQLTKLRRVLLQKRPVRERQSISLLHSLALCELTKSVTRSSATAETARVTIRSVIAVDWITLSQRGGAKSLTFSSTHLIPVSLRILRFAFPVRALLYPCFPLPFSLLRLCLPFIIPFCRPLNPARESEERCKLPQIPATEAFLCVFSGRKMH